MAEKVLQHVVKMGKAKVKRKSITNAQKPDRSIQNSEKKMAQSSIKNIIQNVLF